MSYFNFLSIPPPISSLPVSLFQLAGLPLLSLSVFRVLFSLTIEPDRQVFALHAVVLLAQVPQNDWLCTQEVVERCWIQLLICTNKMQALVLFCFSATIVHAYNERRSSVQQGDTKQTREQAPAGSAEPFLLKWMQHAKLNWTSGLPVQPCGCETDGKCCRFEEIWRAFYAYVWAVKTRCCSLWYTDCCDGADCVFGVDMHVNG